MDKFLEQLPFLTAEHRTLATDIESFVKLEIETRAIEERDLDAQLREFVGVLAKASALHYAVVQPGTKLDVRALCLIREAKSAHVEFGSGLDDCVVQRTGFRQDADKFAQLRIQV